MRPFQAKRKNVPVVDKPVVLLSICWALLLSILIFGALYVRNVIAQERTVTPGPQPAPPGTVQRVTYKCGSLIGQGLVTIYLEPEPAKPAMALIAVIDCKGNPA
jgi:hypothetical protein